FILFYFFIAFFPTFPEKTYTLIQNSRSLYHKLRPPTPSSHLMPAFSTTTPSPVAAITATTTRMSTNSTVKRPTPLWFGGAASCVAVLVSHPFDLAKVRLQTVQGNAQNGMLKTIVLIIRNEGFFRIYSGLSAGLLRQATYSTVRFGGYDGLKQIVTKGRKPTFWEMIFCSTISGCMGGAVGNPADVVNVRMQNDGSLPLAQRRHYRNAIDGLVRIVREEGVTTLARGLGPNVNRAILMTTSQLVSYDVFKDLLVKRAGWGENVGTHFGASLLAGLVATTVCSPVDVIKTRVMNSSASADSRSPVSIFVSTIRNEGPAALFKGWTPAFVRLAPQTIVTFMVLEQLKNIYAKMEDKRVTGVVQTI
ncbi:mitochondrial carrier domain-containing protein, partial [Endogone sp. FLAS-F59071]